MVAGQENATDCLICPELLAYNGRWKNEATDVEVENLLKKWKRGEERSPLVTDDDISRGWEAPAVMAIGEYSKENLVMRSCGFCFLINFK